MSRQSLVLLLLAIAVPATAQTFGFSIRASAPVCLAIGDISYRIAAPGERADYTVRIDASAQTPDIRIQLTGAIDEADFVFIGEGNTALHCPRVLSSGKTVRIDAAALAPDLVLGFANSSVPPDYRIYVRGDALAPEAAAALYAVAHRPVRRLTADRSN